MIKKLRIKFIIVAMVATALVLFAIIGVINIRNYTSVISRIDKTLSLLVEGGGRFPFEGEYGGLKRPEGISPEMPFETRFFSVRMDNSGEIISSYTDRIAAVDEATAIEYAKEIFGHGKDKGFKGNYRYAVSSSDDYTDIVFLDSTRNLDTFHSFLQTSILISVA